MGSFPTIGSISDEKETGSLLDLMLISFSNKPNVQTQSYANSFLVIEIRISYYSYFILLLFIFNVTFRGGKPLKYVRWWPK